jgi:hypothetical protein
MYSAQEIGRWCLVGSSRSSVARDGIDGGEDWGGGRDGGRKWEVGARDIQSIYMALGLPLLECAIVRGGTTTVLEVI